MLPKPRLAPWVLCTAVSLVLGACGVETPLDRMHAFIDRAENEIERRDSAHIRGMLAEDFVGQGTLTRDRTMDKIQSYLLTHREIHVLTHEAVLELNGAHGAHAVVYAALTSQEADTADALSQIEADIIRFEFDIATDENAELRVTDALWQKTSVNEMLAAGWRGKAQ